MSHLYEHIGRANKWIAKTISLEEGQAARQADKTKAALELARRLREHKKPEPEPTRLQALPISN